MLGLPQEVSQDKAEMAGTKSEDGQEEGTAARRSISLRASSPRRGRRRFTEAPAAGAQAKPSKDVPMVARRSVPPQSSANLLIEAQERDGIMHRGKLTGCWCREWPLLKVREGMRCGWNH